MEPKTDADGFWKPWKIALAVLLIWAAFGFAPFFLAGKFERRLPQDMLSRTGTFGDTFGAVNSLFSALGVAGVAYALILQYREQHEARAEAEKSRTHDTELAMLAAMLNAHAVLTQVSNQNVFKIQDIIINIRKNDPKFDLEKLYSYSDAALAELMKHSKAMTELMQEARKKMTSLADVEQVVTDHPPA